MSNTINADPAELEKFSSLAHRWWDPESEFKPLHQINPLRLDWINAQAPLVNQRVPGAADNLFKIDRRADICSPTAHQRPLAGRSAKRPTPMPCPILLAFLHKHYTAC